MRFEVTDGPDAVELLEPVRAIYAEVYAEPPYNEGPAQVEDFVERWPHRCAARQFRLVLAYHGDTATGMAFGYQLPDETRWWGDLHVPYLTDEWPGRTFAVIEVAVRKAFRRAGVAARLHELLLAGRPEERATLLVRPEPAARPAQLAYRSWGYRVVGRHRPYEDAPVYEAMYLPLPPRQ